MVEEEAVIDLAKCCRTCLQQKQNNMKPLSTYWNDSLTLTDMLRDILMDQQFLSDPIHLHICGCCEVDLITAYNFRNVCRKTERILHRQFPISNSVKEESDNSVCSEQSMVLAVQDDEDTFGDNSTPNNLDDTFVDLGKRKCTRHSQRTVADGSSSDTDEKDIVDEDPTFVPPEPKSRRRSQKQIDNTCGDETQPKRKYVRRKPPKERATKGPDKSSSGMYCRRCDQSFEFRKLYIAHYKEVHTERMPCMLCGKLFYKHNIEKHMISHSKEKNYVCSLCGSRFSYDNNLKSHMRIHSGEKRYKCDFCDESFIHWNTKKNHMYIKHTKVKKYECYICHQMFGQNSTMKNHVRYHTGDLPHPCPFCQKRFISFYKLKKHVVTHRNIPADQRERFL